MSTFATYLQGTRKDLALWITIQGIDRVFKERSSIDCSAILGETRPESAIIPAKGIEIGEERVDLKLLAQVGGQLRFRLREPRGSTVVTDLVQPRKRRRTYVAANASSSVATITVGDTSWVSAPDLAYIGGETIAVGSVLGGPPRLNGCTRGKYGSRAQAHPAATANTGTEVYDVPTTWIGRRVSLYASFVRPDGTTTSALTRLLMTAVIEKEVEHVGDRTWQFSCGPLADEYASRKLYVGLKESRGGRLYIDDPSDDFVKVEVEDARFFAPSATFSSYALIKIAAAGGPVHFVGKVLAADTLSTPNLIDVQIIPGYIAGSDFSLDNFSDGDDPSVESVKHFALVGGASVQSVVQALTSIVGDTANGSFDVLPGRARTSFEDDGWRMGAAIHQDDVDNTGLLAVPSPDTRFWYILDDTATVGELMKEWCFAAGAFWFVNSSGKISAQRNREIASASVLTINDAIRSGRSAPRVWYDESAVYPLVRFTINYDPLARDFLVRHLTVDQGLLHRYPQRDEVLEMKLKGIGLDLSTSQLGVTERFVRPATITQVELADIARRLQKSGSRGDLMVEVPCKLAGLAAGIGDVVEIGFDLPDLEGGNLNGRSARVIARRPLVDEDCAILTLQIFDSLFLFVPSAVAAAAPTTTSIANDTLELSSTDPANDDSTPQNNFPVGCSVRLWDVSAGTSQVLVVAAQLSSPPRLRFTAGVSGAIEVGKDWLTWNTLGTNTGLAAANGKGEDDFLYQMPDSGVAAAGETRRWR